MPAIIIHRSGGRVITLDAGGDSLMARLNRKHPDGYLEHVVTRFVEYSRDVVTLAVAVGACTCPPGVLADWIEEHPEYVRAGLDASEVCRWLRAAAPGSPARQ